jgi:CHAT domain-containing protein
LVTLGACETGRNKVLHGDELLGMVRAFIYAGTPSVLVSLWPVDELSTRILMETFYRNLLDGYSKGESLRMAQQQLRNLSQREVVARLASFGESNPEERVRQLLALSQRLPAAPTIAAPTVAAPKAGSQLSHQRSIGASSNASEQASAQPAARRRTDAIFSHPYFWASFVLMGDAG